MNAKPVGSISNRARRRKIAFFPEEVKKPERPKRTVTRRQGLSTRLVDHTDCAEISNARPGSVLRKRATCSIPCLSYLPNKAHSNTAIIAAAAAKPQA